MTRRVAPALVPAGVSAQQTGMNDNPDQPGAPAPADVASAGRFERCRWRTAPDGGDPAYCTHRDVRPYAGTSGFNPLAWCPDCAHYKPRRGARPRRDEPFDDY